MLAKMGCSDRLALWLSPGPLLLLVSEDKAYGVSPAKADISLSRRGLGSVERGRPHPEDDLRRPEVTRAGMSGWVAVSHHYLGYRGGMPISL